MCRALLLLAILMATPDDLEEFRARTDVLEAHQRRIVNRLQRTGQAAFYIDYADILDLDILNGLAAFLGVEGRLEALDYRYKKQNPEAIEAKVSNPAEMKGSSAATVEFLLVGNCPRAAFSLVCASALAT